MTQTHHQDPRMSAGSEPHEGTERSERTAEIPQQETRPVWFGEAPGPAHAAPGTAPGPFGAFPQSPAGPPPPAPPRGGAEPAQPAKSRRWAELTAVAALAAVLASGGTYAANQLGSAATQSSSTASAAPSLGRGTDTAPVDQADPNNPNWTATSAAVAPSVVAISVSSDAGGGQGSGVVIDREGHILTNNHVVTGAGSSPQIEVTLNDGRTYAATIAGTDASTDLAVITLSDPPKDLAPIALGDSDALKVGDPVMAVGNPLGLAGTVTTGIVSALDRPVRTGTDEGGSDQQAPPVVTNAIQTSAAINPGNSGGALVNAGGQLVGINSSIATLGSSGGSQSGSIGIGFAIPVNEAKNIAGQLIKDGSAKHALLGVTSRDGTATDGSAKRAGATVVEVSPGTPAAEAGLRTGDTVIAVDGDRVDSTLSLVAHVRERSVGDKVTLNVLRDGKRLELNATLTAKSTSSQ